MPSKLTSGRGGYQPNQKLREAIHYLESEGRGDATDLYLTRVQIIDDRILKAYPAQGTSFDSTLYERLRSLVRLVQSNVQDANEQDGSSSSTSGPSNDPIFEGVDNNVGSNPDSSDDQTSVISVPSDDPDEAPRVERQAIRPSFVKTSKFRDLSPDRPTDQVRFEDHDMHNSNSNQKREKPFLYGGPNNDLEVWYEKSPPLLHIGETPYMEEWESMKINYDLAKSQNESFDKFGSEEGFARIDVYDSGSPYKLPTGVSSKKDQSKDQYGKVQALWPSIRWSFNSGGRSGQTEAPPGPHKYSLRIVLPLVGDMQVKPATPSDEGLAARTNRKQAHLQKPANDVSEWLRVRSQRSRLDLSTPLVSHETNLKKFNSKREEATKRDKTNMPSPREAAILKARATLAVTPTPTPGTQLNLSSERRNAKRRRGEQDDEESSKRKRHRQAKWAQDLSYRPPRSPSSDADSPRTPQRSTLQAEVNELTTSKPIKPQRTHSHKTSRDPNYRPSQSPLTPTTRKRDENLNLTPPSRRISKLKKTPRSSSTAHVDFAGEEPPPSTMAVPSNKATPSKSAIKKPKRSSAKDGGTLHKPGPKRKGQLKRNKETKRARKTY